MSKRLHKWQQVQHTKSSSSTDADDFLLDTFMYNVYQIHQIIKKKKGQNTANMK